MQSYNSNSKPQIVSFDLGGGFWRHVKMNGRIGVDQHGDRWINKGNSLYSEFSSRIIDLNSKEVIS